MDVQIKELVQKLQEEKQKIQIDISHIYNSLRIGITTIIIDTDLSLTIDLKNDAKGSLFREAVGLSSTLIANRPFHHIHLFENLWIQSELEEQKIKYYFSNSLIIMKTFFTQPYVNNANQLGYYL